VLKPSYPIETPRLLLRPFDYGDLEALHAFHSLPEVARYLYWDPRDLERTKEVLEEKVASTALNDEGDMLSLAVEVRATGELAGDLYFFWRSREHKLGELGYVFDPRHQGRGYATEAARELLGIGFDGLGLHRMIARCDARNVASWRVMERLGMRREAHLVENEFVKGEWTDELIYAMLRREWEAAAA
jgi:RimJ/RimL family protein N-acetyltransferase